MGLIIIYRIVDAFFTLLFWLIIAHIILSWIPHNNPIIRQISEVVESIVQPIFKPFRKIVPVIDLGGVGFDLTPIVVIFLIRITHSIVNQVLLQLL